MRCITNAYNNIDDLNQLRLIVKQLCLILYVKITIIYLSKRLCVPDCAYTENIFINSIHVSLYDIPLTQNISYQIKRDVAV